MRYAPSKVELTRAELFNLALFSFALEETAREILALLVVSDSRVTATANVLSICTRLQPLRKLFVSLLPFAGGPGKRNPFAGSVKPAFVLQKDANLGLRIRHRLWVALQTTKRPDVRFSIKCGIGAILLAAPAFVPSSRPIWVGYRGEWAMISYAVVCRCVGLAQRSLTPVA